MIYTSKKANELKQGNDTDRQTDRPMRCYQGRDEGKAVREKQHITPKGSSGCPATDFSREDMEDRAHGATSQAEKEKLMAEEN